MKKLNRVSYIDASCQDWFHLEKICFTLANQKQELVLTAIFVGQME
jgi:hypothetical protein